MNYHKLWYNISHTVQEIVVQMELYIMLNIISKFNNFPKNLTGLPTLLLRQPVLHVRWPSALPQRT